MVTAVPPSSRGMSRRRVAALSLGGVASLLLPARAVRGDSHTLAARLRRELKELSTDLATKEIPRFARSVVEDVFDEKVAEPAKKDLLSLSPTFQEERRIDEALDMTKLRIGDLTETFTAALLRGDDVLDTLRQSADVSSRLDQPTFQYPFTPEFSYDVGTPTPSTSQSAADMLQTLREGDFPVDPSQLSVKWDFIDLTASTEFDRVRFTASVEADDFLDRSFNIVPPNWKAEARLSWRMFQNGAVNELNAAFRGEFPRDEDDVWTLLISGRFRF